MFLNAVKRTSIRKRKIFQKVFYCATLWFCNRTSSQCPTSVSRNSAKKASPHGGFSDQAGGFTSFNTIQVFIQMVMWPWVEVHLIKNLPKRINGVQVCGNGSTERIGGSYPIGTAACQQLSVTE